MSNSNFEIAEDFNDIDYDDFERRVREMRAEAMAQGVKSAVAWVRSQFSGLHFGVTSKA